MPLASYDSTVISVYEITMALPNLIRVEIRDPEIIKGGLVGPGDVETANYSTLINRTNPNTGNLEWAFVRGENKDYLKFEDIRATEYLDRAAAIVVADWSITGGYTITDIYHQHQPYDQGWSYSPTYGSAGQVCCQSFRHWIWLKLDAALANGSYTIGLPSSLGISDITFDFDDRVTRNDAIKVNQVGFRPDDPTKYGMYGLWLPGAPNEGQTELSSPLPNAWVINKFGAKIAPVDVSLRIGPTDVEPVGLYGGTGDTSYVHYNGLSRYISTNYEPIKITDAVAGTPTTVTYDDTGAGWSPANDDILAAQGWDSTLSIVSRVFGKVSNLDTGAKTFDLDFRTGGSFSSGQYIDGYDNLLFRTHLANSAATYVYLLDFSSTTDFLPGNYRIYIEGHGVSDEFKIDHAVYFQLAKYAHYALTSQRNGPALDLPTWSRPDTMVDSASKRSYKSLVPAPFSTELGGNVSPVWAGESPFITTNYVDGSFIGHQDAGDWDSYLYAHARHFYFLLTFGYELLPSAVRDDIVFDGIPLCTEVFPGDPYVAGTDIFPSPVQEALFEANTYRLTQAEDGSVVSGMATSVGGASSEQGNGAGPSWILGTAFPVLYAPDHLSNFCYVFLAAKLAQIFKAAGLTSLSSLWEASAQAAWDWANPIFVNASGEQDAYYEGTLNFTNNCQTIYPAWDAAHTTTAMNTLLVQDDYVRRAAAATMFNLNGDTDMKTIAEESLGNTLGYDCIQAWEYINADGADSSIVASWTATFSTNDSFLSSSVVPYSQNAIYRDNGYYYNKPINSIPIYYFHSMMSYILTDDADWIDTFIAGASYMLGCNQFGKCHMVGVGARDFRRTTLQEDTIRQGMTARTGTINYGIDPGFYDASGFPVSTQCFMDDNTYHWNVENPTGDHEADYGTARIVYPRRWATPTQQAIFECRYQIAQMEYTFEAPILPHLIIFLYLHARAGNTQSQYATGEVELSMRRETAP